MTLFTAQLILTYLAMMLSLASLAFAVGGSLGAWTAWVALPLAAAFLYWRLRPGIYRFSISLAILVFLLAASLATADLFYDISYDGQVYHQEAVRQLAAGWNPWHEYLERSMSHSAILLDHYARGPWIYGAAFYDATGSLEAGKAGNFLLMSAAVLYGVAALRRLGASRITAWSTALIAALNPVVIYQSFSFYIDGQLASLLLCLAAAASLYLQGEKRQEAGIVSAIILAANVKFTGIVYAVAWGGLLLAALFFSGKRETIRHFLLTVFGGGILGAVIIGWNPYMTNLIFYGHPFYPLYGAGDKNMDIMTLNFPVGFAQLGMLSKLALANLAESSNGFDNVAPALKIPFALRPAELAPFAYGADVRIGGFGPWFSGICALAIAVLSALLFRGGQAAALLFCAALMLTVLINPEAWWARYAPQFWLIPAVLAFAALKNSSLFLRSVGAALLTVMMVNIVLVGYAYGLGNHYATLAYKQEAAKLAARPEPVKFFFGVFNSNEERFKKLAVPYEIADGAAQAEIESFRYRYLSAVQNQPGLRKIFLDEKERLRRANHEKSL